MLRKLLILIILLVGLLLFVVFLWGYDWGYNAGLEACPQDLIWINSLPTLEIPQHLDEISRIRQIDIIRNEIQYWNLNDISRLDAIKRATLIYEVAEENNIDPLFMTAIGIVESNLTQNRTSYAGATGIYQLMPLISKHYKYDRFSLEGNIKCGTKYIADLVEQYDSKDLALAHYNAGNNPEEKIKQKSVQNYVWNVKNVHNSLKRRYKNGR